MKLTEQSGYLVECADGSFVTHVGPAMVEQLYDMVLLTAASKKYVFERETLIRIVCHALSLSYGGKEAEWFVDDAYLRVASTGRGDK